MILPLAHHNAVAALPVFAPAVVICAVLLFNYLRSRGEWDEEEEGWEEEDERREVSPHRLSA